LNYLFLSREGIASSRAEAGQLSTTPSATTRRLLAWFDAQRRTLPWRLDRDPYRLWVAEVLLQQTRVAQAVPYFERFVARFPDLRSLARADEEEVLKVWEGAGYYGRARRLHAAARHVVERGRGRLPTTRAELAQLPGVGPYIAAAVASLAFDEPVVALEANGLRVAARLRLERGDVRRPPVRRRLELELARYLPTDRPGAFNEAIMELGETVCLPRAPACPRCPLGPNCRAFQELDDPASIPRPHRRPRRPTVVAAIVVVDRRGRWLVRRRPPAGLLGGLWEFPGGKPGPRETLAQAARREVREETGLRLQELTKVGIVHHAYSHFSVQLHVFRANARGRVRSERPYALLRWVAPREFELLPRPMATRKAIQLLAPTAAASRGSGSRPGRTAA
jgi:A/G-specific adenine glycosylase